jgi:cysteine desulfurase / selenocysteine lyase
MPDKIIYFDNAATSYPKPESVYLASDSALRLAGNPGRGAHRLSFLAASAIFEAREALAAHFKIDDSSRLVFTGSCTASINLVISGLIGNGTLKAGSSVLVSSYEHNAVMRSLTYHVEHSGIKTQVLPASNAPGLVDMKDLEAALASAPLPALAILTAASNVTGELLDRKIIERLSKAGVPVLLDGAQSAGRIEENLSEGLAFYATSGHKGLLGPPGVGLLFCRADMQLDPPFCGGTGSRSESYIMPDFLPDRLEPGTAAVHLAAALHAGLDYISEKGMDKLLAHELALGEKFLNGLNAIEGISLKGRKSVESGIEEGTETRKLAYLPVFSFAVKDLTASWVAAELDTRYGIAVRPGLHCAVSTHQVLGTVEEGLSRVSIGPFNTEEDVDLLLAALREIAGGPGK